MLAIVITYLGLAMGSFIDALTWRLWHLEQIESGEKKPKKAKDETRYSIVNGRSMCESCEHQLGAKDLIPLLSWLSTGGKCRYCGHKIGWQTPAIEVLMAAIFLGLYLMLPRDGLSDAQSWFVLITWLIYSVGLVAIAVYDLRHLLIPNRIILPLISLSVVVALINAVVFDGGAEAIKEAVLGLFVGGGLFYALFLVSGGRWLGGGDVKLGFFIGLALGPLLAGVALWLSFMVALLIILPLMLFKVIQRRQPVPFGPFLIIATFIAVIWGQRLADWYNDQFLYGLF